MNIPDAGGLEESYTTTTVSIPSGPTSADISMAPDAMAAWPVVAIVGVCMALCLTMVVLASMALARRGR